MLGSKVTQLRVHSCCSGPAVVTLLPAGADDGVQLRQRTQAGRCVGQQWVRRLAVICGAVTRYRTAIHGQLGATAANNLHRTTGPERQAGKR